MFICALLFTLTASANPVVGNVAAGQVSIQQTPSTTTVNQASQKAIINWQSFNIGAQEATHFQQPAGGVALNRISPTQGASQIYGRLTATGQIILSNPAGVYFGPSAYVNVGGIIATTANLSDQDFMNGNYNFQKVPGYSGAVINEGQIVAAQNGLVALVAPGVINKGVIQASVGHVILASGDAFTVNFSGDNLINFKVTSGASSRGVDKDGNVLKDGVSNTGSIFADAGRVLITAKAAAGVLDSSIDMRGSVQARSIYAQNGEIIISGDPNAGLTKVAAKLDASAGTTGVNGGFIETSGHTVDLSGVQIDVSAPLGKTGNWLIDPADFTIDVSGNSPNLAVTDLVTALSSANVTIQTTASGTGGNGDIFVNADISWSSGNKLTLSAYRNITSIANITNTGGASVVLQADNTGIGTGTVSFTGGKNVSLSGGSGTVKIYYNPTVFGTQDAIYAGGTLPTQYMLINDTTDLNALSVSASKSENYALGRDIDASSLVGFTSIGSSITPFTGKFDGQSHKISNLTISSPAVTDVGLFGAVGAAGVVENVAVSGSVTGNADVGLLAGNNAGTLRNVFTNGQVIGNGNNIGGLVGLNSGTITDAYSTASVIAAASSNVGGLVGNNSGTIATSFSTGMVSGNSSVGGLVGTNSGTVTNSYWNTETSGQASSAGGTGNTTANMMLQATYTGFDFTNTWNIISGKSYPYLLSFYPTTPRAISGTLNALDRFSNVSYENTNQTIKLATNSAILDSTQTGANGEFYFLEGNGTLVDAYPFLAYVSGSATTKGNTITVAPPSGGSIINLPIYPNEVLVSDNGIATLVPLLFPTGTITYDYVYTQISDYFNANLGFAFQNYLKTLGYTDATTFFNTYPIISGDVYAQITLDDINGLFVSMKYGGFNFVTLATADQSGIHFLPANITTMAELDNYVATFQAQLTASFTTVFNTITNDSLVYALGNFTGNDFLYTTSGSDVNVKDGYNFSTGTHTNFGLTGNLSTINGSIIFNGPLQVGPLITAYDENVTVQTINSGNIKTMDLVLWAMGDSVSTDTLNLTSANNIFLNKPVMGVLDDNNTLLLTAGSLKLSAAYTDQSITTGFLAHISVDSLAILQGKWYQDSLFYGGYLFAGQNEGALDAGPFIKAINFSLGTTNTEFIRAFGGDGTAASPYLIGDYFGFQGIGSSANTLSLSYKIVNTFGNRIDRNITKFWNDGLGFRPIGDVANPFTGTIDGLFNGRISSINGIQINRPLESNVGIFGVLSSSAIIKNLYFDNTAVIGNDNVGMLAGINNGSISYMYGRFIQVQGNNNVGTLVGVNNGIINNISLVSSFANGNDVIGGIAGINAAGATISKVLAHSYINDLGNSSAVSGGIAGNNLGSISNSFWDTDFSGQNQSTGFSSGTLTQVAGGCFQGFCTNGGTVNLSLLTTYTAKGWNFSSNTWGILNGKSYPYLEPILGWTGFGPTRMMLSVGPGDPTMYDYTLWPNYMSVIAGVTSPMFAQQYIRYLGAVVPYTDSRLPIYSGYSFTTITGADGSFYMPFYQSHYVNDAVAYGIKAYNGNASSDVIVVPISNFSSQVSIVNIKLPITINSALPNNYAPTIVPALLGLNLTGGQLLQFFNIGYGAFDFVTPGYEQFRQQAESQAIALIYLNYLNVINFSLYAGLTPYDNDTYLLDQDYLNYFLNQNLKSIANNLHASDLIINSKLDIIPIAPKCGS